MSSNVYDFSLPAAVGASQLMPVVGSQCLITNLSTYQVQVTTETGEKYKLFEGQGFDFQAITGRTFSWLLITNLQAVAVSGSIFIGDSGWIDRRMFGTVAVVDGERQKVVSGVSFTAVGSLAGSTSGPNFQIWNAAGTGKTLFVQSVIIGASAADSWNISTITNILNAAASGVPNNKNPSGAASLAVLRQDNLAQGLVNQKTHAVGYVAASTDRLIEFKRPVMVPQGAGLSVLLNTAATTLRVAVEFEEWAA